MTMTRGWTLEMTEDWTHTRVTEHDKACVLQITVEHKVASEHFNWSGRKRPRLYEGQCRQEKKRYGTSLLRT